MSFDKTKAMRNAERYVAQGKIRAAISEYRAVVDNDPRDFATLNMLGDLYAKTAEKREAVECYFQVADHYNSQGFSQKAIAIYNKISRIQPDSIEVSTKLAELHKVKGSLSEARSHYILLAEHYQRNGRMIEALSMYKQIALLDPNNTDVCISLANAYLRENKKNEAVDAYVEAGTRFSRMGKYEDAIGAFMKGFDVKSSDMRVLGGIVKAHTALNQIDKAELLLQEILENEPYNRDVLYLMIDICIGSKNGAAAEAAITKLVEIEPANYTKFLDLIRIYSEQDDHESAARILTMSAEYLLAGGQADEFGKWINQILERDPAHLGGLRLLVRYNAFRNDKTGIRLALERLYSNAVQKESVEDEHYALIQLVVIHPNETRYQDRLKEINEQYDFGEDVKVDEASLIERFGGDVLPGEPQEYELNDEVANAVTSNGHVHHDEIIEATPIESEDDVLEAQIVEEDIVAENTGDARTLSPSDELKVQAEIESIDFYIENDYHDLAIKALTELAQQFGERPAFGALRERIGGDAKVNTNGKRDTPVPEPEVENEIVANTLGINEIRSEFGLETDEAENADYDTHFHMAVAYQEMGLLEEAIKEFQDAINLTRPDDGSRRFFHCANLLGHCFFQNGMANHAITWLNRALQTPNISDEEHQGLWYELALAHEASGDDENAARYFEQIYAENVDFRDVSSRVKNVVTDS